jgi:two-component system, cell cycle sensor histidine kinase and response regulator CckA
MDVERSRLFLDLAIEGFWDFDLKTGQVYLSPKSRELFGYPPEDALFDGAFLAAMVHPEDLERVLSESPALLRESRDLPAFVCRMVSRDGSPRFMEIRCRVAEQDPQGSPTRLVGTVVEIAGQERAEVKARELTAEDQLKLKSFTIDNVAEAIVWTGPDCSIWDVNAVACKKLGYTREELLCLTIPDIDPSFPKELLQSHSEKLKEVGSIQFESLHKTKDGRVFPVEIVSNYLLHNGREYHCSMVRDISERKRLEKALQESEARFRTLCDCAPIGIFKWDAGHDVSYVNPRWEEIAGMPAAEAMGQGWLLCVHPEDRESLVRAWSEATSAGRSYSYEHRLITAAGSTIWVHSLARPIKSSDGKTAGYVGTVEDITEFRQARMDQLKTQKLESLGLLAGGIAHDFNNILTSILGNISLARFQMDDPEKVATRLENAETATARAKDLTQQLLTFARGGEPIKKIIEVRGLLEEAVGFALQGTNVGCKLLFADDIWPVKADEGQLIQVINNLVLNAVQAMPEGGMVTVCASNANSAPGKRSVTIAVTDTGVGISEQHLQKIFDPYFTTKKQGSGLGLATCYSIIRKHGGSIKVSSFPGKGSSFEVSLPAVSPASGGRSVSRFAVAPGGGRVLVMDDEEVVRAITKTILEEFDFTVECTKDGAEAVALYRQRMEEGTPFSVVILDLTIPGGVGGKDTIKMLLEMDPDVKAIVSSGYSNDPVMGNYREYGFRAVLKKPYLIKEMTEVLHELLGGGSGS